MFPKHVNFPWRSLVGAQLSPNQVDTGIGGYVTEDMGDMLHIPNLYNN